VKQTFILTIFNAFSVYLNFRRIDQIELNLLLKKYTVENALNIVRMNVCF